MSKCIGHITEETWPEARSVLDAFRVDYRTTPDRYAGHVKGYSVWVEGGDLHTEPWWEELVQASWDGRVVWRVEGKATALAGSEHPQRSQRSGTASVGYSRFD